MSSLSPKDRVSLCRFTFADGRRCRTPRISSHAHFCFYHAQKEARTCAAEKLGKDLAYFFSGDYLSACDLSTALARLIPAVVRGEVKPRAARTVAYLAQTLIQAIHVSQHEYCEAFDTDDWRQAIRNSVNANHDYLFPPDPKPEPPAPSLQTNMRIELPQPQPHPAQPQSSPPQPQQPVEPPVNCHSERSEESASSSNSSLATHHSPLPPAPQPAPSPHTPLPPTSAEFAQHVLAGLQTGERQAPQPAQATEPAPPQTRSPIPTESTPTPTATLPPAPPPIPATQSIRSAVPAPQPAPATQPFRSLALPPHVSRRLHRDPA